MGLTRVKAVVGTDIGTGGVKSLLLTQRERIVRSRFVEHPIIQVEGRIEQNPIDWWIGAKLTLSQIAEIADRENIQIVGHSQAGQMHGDVILDAHGKVIAPATLWNSPHNGEHLKNLVSQGDNRKTIIELTGNGPFTRAPGAKLAWRKDNQPELFARIAKFTTPDGYLASKLTGKIAIDASEAGMALLFDNRKREWSQTLFEVFGLPMHIAPPVYNSFETMGYVTKQAALETKLPEGIPVAAGGGDQTTSAIGNGVVKKGRVSITLGSSGVVAAYSEGFNPDPSGLIHFLPDGTGHYYFMACSLFSGDSLKWWRSLLFGEKPPKDAYGKLLGEVIQQKIPAGSRGLVFLPFFNASNHPIRDPYAKGVVFGLQSFMHHRAWQTRAILEGVAVELAISIDKMQGFGVPVEEVILAGGGAKDETELWPQIFADILQRPVTINREQESTALGAAIIAGVNAGLWPNFEEACSRVISFGKTYEPNPANQQVYQDLQGKFLATYEALKGRFEATGLPGVK